MQHIPLTIESLRNLEEDEDPNLHEKKQIFEYLEKHLNMKQTNYELLSMGSHGVVISPSFIINSNDELSKDFENLSTDSFISKVLNLDNEEEIYIEKEIHISKKLKKIDKKYEHFIYPCSFEKIDKHFYNIIMKKGFDFELNIQQLHFKQLLNCLYNLVDSIKILSDNNILLLDLKPDNFLFSEIKEHFYKSVIIDFSGELLIENTNDFDDYISNFEFYCHDFWPAELTILLHRVGLKNQDPKDKDLVKKEIHKYEEIIKLKFGYNDSKNINYQIEIYSHLIKELHKIRLGGKSDLYQKIMLYQIGRSFEYILYKYKKHLKLTRIQRNIFSQILLSITDENYFSRVNIRDFKTSLKKYIPKHNCLIKIDKIL
tara:strand:- start:845 stop:1960 length:1116 start_codon:yes stop_codon:yes gene_type:complete